MTDQERETHQIVIGLLLIEARAKQTAEYADRYAKGIEAQVVELLRLLWSKQPEPRPAFDEWLTRIKQRHQAAVNQMFAQRLGGHAADREWVDEASSLRIPDFPGLSELIRHGHTYADADPDKKTWGPLAGRTDEP